MLTLLQQEPVWIKTMANRLGAEYRSKEGRVMHVKDLGWFIRMRGEFNLVSGLTASNGIAGPFDSQDLAFAYLRHSIRHEQTSQRNN